jgi:ring-1,2-phenylacetyl-CoA epoxidase subunit PaaA
MPIYIFEMRDQAEDWLEYGLFSFFADRQGAYMGYEWVGCSYEPLARIAERVHKEELGHAAFGYRLIRRYLQREGDPGRELLKKHLAKWYPAGLDMFGKSGSKRQFDYVRWGLRRRSNEQMRDEFTEEVNNLLTKLEIPIPDPATGRRFS